MQKMHDQNNVTKQRTSQPHIAVSPETYEQLCRLGGFKESFDDIVKRLLDNDKNEVSHHHET